MSAYFWQVAVHATVMGFIFYAWARHVRLPSGRTKRWLLALLLVMPLLTAAVPGRSGPDFAEGVAWLNSARILAIPLGAGVRVEHLVLAGAVLMIGVTVWQELALAVRRPHASPANVPDAVVQIVRARAGWPDCAIAISPAASILVATSGWPSRPRLLISRGALESLSEDQLAIVVSHEHAHWQDGRWWRLHGLFLLRLLQCYHPVALWVFREYCLEIEVDCDRAAARSDGRPLARILLLVYEHTDRRDRAARAALRKRVDVLMAGGPQDAALPVPTIAAAAVLMGVLLPWIV
ncbi:MAG TPA: hypothetical protein VFO31_17940 [Vicinamibacterales bacterium]|nr:hypothetical protein [Vicinamibacterales bacterium]